jgi:signal transduction histidine kinase
MQHQPPRGYIAVHLCLLGLALVVTVIVSEADDWQPIGLLAILLAFAIAGALTPVRVGPGNVTLTDGLSYVLAASLLGPAPAVAISVANTLVDSARRRVPSSTAIENLTTFAIGPLVYGLAFHAIVGRLGSEPGDWDFALLVVGLYTAMHLLSFAMVAIQFRIADGVAFGQIIRDGFIPTLPLESIAASLTGLVTVAYGEMGVPAVAGVLPFALLGDRLMRELVRSRERAREIAQLADSRRTLIAKALDAEDKARRDLAQGLHDNTIQLLLAAQQEMVAVRAGDAEGVARVDESVRSAIKQLRMTTFDLHPAVLRHAGLAAALRTLADYHAEKAGFHVDVDVGIDGEIGEARARLVIALAQELLVNAARHAAASQVQVNLRRRNARIELEVRDDGRGFEPDTRTAAVLDGHIGLASVAERAEEARGSFTLESTPGAGTRVLIELPAADA